MSAAEHNHAPRVVEPEPEDPPAAGAPAWTATFGNLMMLLLCFFVLQLSFATIEARRAKGDGLPVDSPLIDLSDGASVLEGEALPEVGPTPEEEMMELIDRAIRQRGLGENIEAAIGASGVTVRVDGPLLFQSDTDALKPEAAGVFEEIAELAVLFPYDIAVEGHSGDVPQPGGRFATDWELSTAQAVAAVRYLIEVGRIAPERMHVAGFAHTRPLAENGNEVDQARNHRLEFVFHRPQPGRSAAPATTRTPHAQEHAATPSASHAPAEDPHGAEPH